MTSKKSLKQNEPTLEQKQQSELLEMKKKYPCKSILSDPVHLKEDIFRLK